MIAKQNIGKYRNPLLIVRFMVFCTWFGYNLLKTAILSHILKMKTLQLSKTVQVTKNL